MNTKQPPTFIADCHLGKLAKYLRIMGFDTLYFSSIDDNDLIALARAESRTILTRDRALHERKESPSFYLQPISNLAQLQALQNHFHLKKYQLTSRCLICNITLKKIEKAEIEDKLPPKVKYYFSEFETCPKCHRIYWHGDHYKRMMSIIHAI
ncbi:Mut7-C RNAse domain-containing protein [Sulfurimonas autotrophica]|uniref:Mut7-C RNAse domain-containing protein n=1 Tax=Sulfurimonas autotrophica (strain ATCC BAA-671 / DSM 16294 / JCM 11897 / OK10) TaxID=563040 RepID=E0UT45_SULAO|nr:Mut7-C RNAse domain-containing protein [Sulfurimonas autotrophica]ADN09286.1 protein of unknown function DUF82 [Sulfurimonas autotrophica DSM 16294]